MHATGYKYLIIRRGYLRLIKEKRDRFSTRLWPKLGYFLAHNNRFILLS